MENTHSYQKAATGGIIGLDSRRSTNKLENTAYLDSGCNTAVGGVAEPKEAKVIDAVTFLYRAMSKE